MKREREQKKMCNSLYKYWNEVRKPCNHLLYVAQAKHVQCLETCICYVIWFLWTIFLVSDRMATTNIHTILRTPFCATSINGLCIRFIFSFFLWRNFNNNIIFEFIHMNGRVSGRESDVQRSSAVKRFRMRLNRFVCAVHFVQFMVPFIILMAFYIIYLILFFISKRVLFTLFFSPSLLSLSLSSLTITMFWPLYPRVQVQAGCYLYVMQFSIKWKQLSILSLVSFSILHPRPI